MAKLNNITKIEAALRQLKTSIELFVNAGDTVSAYTLVRASEEVLDKICMHRGLERSAMHQGIEAMKISDERKMNIFKKLNAPKNYFKHADRDSEIELQWSDGVIEHFISDCISMYKRINGGINIPCELMAFSMLHRARNVDMYNESNMPEFDYNLEQIKEHIELEGLSKTYELAVVACITNNK